VSDSKEAGYRQRPWGDCPLLFSLGWLWWYGLPGDGTFPKRASSHLWLSASLSPTVYYSISVPQVFFSFIELINFNMISSGWCVNCLCALLKKGLSLLVPTGTPVCLAYSKRSFSAHLDRSGSDSLLWDWLLISQSWKLTKEWGTWPHKVLPLIGERVKEWCL
jgi:hypothetical protein